MRNLEIRCRDCNSAVEHICEDGFREALIRLLTWIPEWGASGSPEMAAAFTEADVAQREGDDPLSFEDLPFFGSQAWSYLIFHKEQARTFHALLNNLIRAAGLDPHQLDRDAWDLIQEDIARLKERRLKCGHTTTRPDGCCAKCGLRGVSVDKIPEKG